MPRVCRALRGFVLLSPPVAPRMQCRRGEGDTWISTLPQLPLSRGLELSEGTARPPVWPTPHKDMEAAVADPM